jgi:hypothetical protein
VSHVLEGGEVGRCMVGSDPAFVIAEDHVPHQCRLFSIVQWLPMIRSSRCASSIREVM